MCHLLILRRRQKRHKHFNMSYDDLGAQFLVNFPDLLPYI